jgi:hypothetical protein
MSTLTVVQIVKEEFRQISEAEADFRQNQGIPQELSFPEIIIFLVLLKLKD